MQIDQELLELPFAQIFDKGYIIITLRAPLRSS